MDVQQAIVEFLEHDQSVRNLSNRTLRAYHDAGDALIAQVASRSFTCR